MSLISFISHFIYAFVNIQQHGNLSVAFQFLISELLLSLDIFVKPEPKKIFCVIRVIKVQTQTSSEVINSSANSLWMLISCLNAKMRAKLFLRRRFRRGEESRRKNEIALKLFIMKKGSGSNEGVEKIAQHTGWPSETSIKSVLKRHY